MCREDIGTHPIKSQNFYKILIYRGIEMKPLYEVYYPEVETTRILTEDISTASTTAGESRL